MSGQENPFDAPQEDGDPRYRPSANPSVDEEPHRMLEEFHAEGLHRTAPVRIAMTPDEAVEHTVWDEPSISPSVGTPSAANGLTYARWLAAKIQATSWQTSWRVSIATALVSGILAWLATFVVSHRSYAGPVHFVLLAPLIQEVLKVALLLWIVEKRPFWFKAGFQIIAAAACSALVFSLWDNLTSNQTVSGWTPWHTGYRWGLYPLLQVGCSLLAAIGLVQIWRDSIEHLRRPQLEVGAAFLGGAVGTHMIVNGFLALIRLSAYGL